MSLRKFSIILIPFLLLVGCGKPTKIETNSSPQTSVETSPEPHKEANHSNPFETPGNDMESQEDPFATPGDTQVENQNRKSILETRERVVGSKFETLTLGPRKYSTATVAEINDWEIRVSHAQGIANVSWEQVNSTVKERWGFDEIAFENLKEKQKQKFAQIEAYRNSPEGIAERDKARALQKKMKFEDKLKEKENQKAAVSELREKISYGKSVINQLRQGKRELENSFQDEDNNAARIKHTRYDGIYGNDRLGGVSTSKTDRSKNLAKQENKIRAAEGALESLKNQLSDALDELAFLEKEILNHSR